MKAKRGFLKRRPKALLMLTRDKKMTGKKNGQSILEYSVIVAVVVAALSLMSIYIRRAIQANLKLIEDQVNTEVVNN